MAVASGQLARQGLVAQRKLPRLWQDSSQARFVYGHDDFCRKASVGYVSRSLACGWVCVSGGITAAVKCCVMDEMEETVICGAK